MRLASLQSLVAAAIVTLVTHPAAADRFILHDDKIIEGRVIEKDETSFLVHTATGMQRLDRDDIAKRKRVTTHFERYLKRAKKLRHDNWQAQLKIAQWARQRKLPLQALVHYERVLELQPHNHDAQTAVKELAPLRPRTATADPSDKEGATARRHKNTIRITPKGDQGSAQARGFLKQELGRFLKELDEPLQPRSGDRCEFELEIKLEANFVKTTKFYGKIPISDRYEGTATVRLFAAGQRDKPLLKLRRFQHQADLSTKLGKERALDLTRQQLLEALLVKLSKHKFFRDRGATPRKSHE
ncbi:MAG: hypothetical protein AAF581_08730 [Planctomycetota bacterium]